MKKVVGDNATLPCHHQFPASNLLDIEWLLQKPNSKQKVVRKILFVFMRFIMSEVQSVLSGQTVLFFHSELGMF